MNMYIDYWFYIFSSRNDEYDTEISQSADTMVLIAIGSLNKNMRDKVSVVNLRKWDNILNISKLWK